MVGGLLRKFTQWEKMTYLLSIKGNISDSDGGKWTIYMKRDAEQVTELLK